jgi:hypothetical protein
MKNIKLFMSVALIAAALSSGAWAQTGQSTPEYQEKLKVAEQIASLASPTGGLAQFMKNMIAPARQALTNQIALKNPQLDASQLKRAIDLHNEAIDRASSRYISEVMPVLYKNLAQAYAEKFSLVELNSIYQYQASNVGRKAQQFTLNELPELMRPAMEAGQLMSAEIASSITRVRVQLVQEGISLK